MFGLAILACAFDLSIALVILFWIWVLLFRACLKEVGPTSWQKLRTAKVSKSCGSPCER